MDEALLTYRGVVYPWQCDHMGHMNVMWYTGKFDEASWALFAHLGLAPATLRESGRGMVAADQHTQYSSELVAGDLVSIHTCVLAVGSKSIRFRHEMRREPEGSVAAVSTLVGVHIDTRLRQSLPLPARVRELAEPLMDCEALR
ncbi:thioesterase family protein [Pseudomonas sp. SG20056]|uniref:acyl-CoA thioesterase n=1 Tax=Pseudomonas sp. SG20056 TaxID=3074146 RepID=UPI00287F8F93|nr:thioesterase family protein [Pseudomonas sp. SG20056]WNF45282.1 thioesterase family protein [Pseudomonas sp. SG20056]